MREVVVETSITRVMGERRLPLASFGLPSEGQGGHRSLPLSLFHFLIWESQHPEDKLPWRGTTRSAGYQLPLGFPEQQSPQDLIRGRQRGRRVVENGSEYGPQSPNPLCC